MITIRLILAASLALFTMKAWAVPSKKGVDAHGGNAVVCKTASGVSTAEAFDRYEGLEMSGLTPDLGPATLTTDQKVQIFLNRVAAHDVLRSERYRQIYNLIQVSSSFAQRSLIKDISDMKTLITPSGDCVQMQAAVQRHDIGLFEKHFVFDNEIWQLMNSESQAMLFQHEIIYYDEVEADANLSDGARLFNQILSSTHAASISQDDYATVVKQNLISDRGLSTVNLFGATVYYVKANYDRFFGVLAREFTVRLPTGFIACAAGGQSTIAFDSAGQFLRCTNEWASIMVSYYGNKTTNVTASFDPTSLVYDAQGQLIQAALRANLILNLDNGDTYTCAKSSSPDDDVQITFVNGQIQSCSNGILKTKTPDGKDWLCYGPQWNANGQLIGCAASSYPYRVFPLAGLATTFECQGALTLYDSGTLKTCSAKVATMGPIHLNGNTVSVQAVSAGMFNITEQGFYVGRLEVLSSAESLKYIKVLTPEGIIQLALPYSKGATTDFNGNVHMGYRSRTFIDPNEAGLVVRVEYKDYDISSGGGAQLRSDTVVYQSKAKP